MRVFVAGATGAIGRPLVELLREHGHSVVGLTRREEGAARLRSAGAEGAIGDALDREAIARIVADANPDAVIHQLTAIPHSISPRRAGRQFEATNRLRTEGTRNLLAAAPGVRFLAQSVAFLYRPEGDAVKSEDAPLLTDPPPAFRPQADAMIECESLTREAGGTVLRYGYFYGPGTTYAPGGDLDRRIRRRLFPVVGDGGGMFSFVHVRDAAEATVAALDVDGGAVLNVVDDEPAPAREWLPVYAQLAGAKPPRHVPAWLGRAAAGRYAVYLMTEQRGASNQRAKATLGWRPAHASWREGFAETLR